LLFTVWIQDPLFLKKTYSLISGAISPAIRKEESETGRKLETEKTNSDEKPSTFKLQTANFKPAFGNFL
jgi:hypothetical protein